MKTRREELLHIIGRIAPEVEGAGVEEVVGVARGYLRSVDEVLAQESGPPGAGSLDEALQQVLTPRRELGEAAGGLADACGSDCRCLEAALAEAGLDERRRELLMLVRALISAGETDAAWLASRAAEILDRLDAAETERAGEAEMRRQGAEPLEAPPEYGASFVTAAEAAEAMVSGARKMGADSGMPSSPRLDKPRRLVTLDYACPVLVTVDLDRREVVDVAVDDTSARLSMSDLSGDRWQAAEIAEGIAEGAAALWPDWRVGTGE